MRNMIGGAVCQFGANKNQNKKDQVLRENKMGGLNSRSDLGMLAVNKDGGEISTWVGFPEFP